MDLENQVEQTSEETPENDELFFFDEDSNWEDKQPTELEKNHKELNKKFTQTSQDYSKMKKEVEDLRQKASKFDELEKKELELKRQEDINIFKNNYSGLSVASVKAISDLQKQNPEKTLEEIASDYGFLQEVDISLANSRNPKWRSFVLSKDTEEKIEISSKTMRKLGFKEASEARKIKSDFWL